MNDINFDSAGLYFGMIAKQTAPANLPSAISNSTRIMFFYSCIGYDRYQIVISRNSNTPYGRYGTGDVGAISWSEWKEL